MGPDFACTELYLSTVVRHQPPGEATERWQYSTCAIIRMSGLAAHLGRPIGEAYPIWVGSVRGGGAEHPGTASTGVKKGIVWQDLHQTAKRLN